MTGTHASRLPVRLALIVALLAAFAAGAALRAPAAGAQPAVELQFICANVITGDLRWSATSSCPANYISIDIAQEAPVGVCVNKFTGILRYPNQGGQCGGHEQALVLGDESAESLCVHKYTRQIRHDTGAGCRPYEFGVTATGAIEAGCDDCYKLINLLAGSSTQGYTTSEIAVSDPLDEPIVDVNVTLDISHTFISDLRVSLRAPDGTNVLLIDQICFDEDDIEVILDDEAATPVTDAACPPTGFGTSSPAPDALSAFDGSQSSGVWTLIVTDLFLGDDGAIDDWSLAIMTVNGALATQSCADCAVPLSENNVGAGVDTSTATVSSANAGTIADVNLTLDLSAGWAGQFMTISLFSPDGTEVMLYDGECILFNMADLEIVYDDEAAAPLTDADCPADGFQSFQPTSVALSSLAGEDPNSVWTLEFITTVDFSAVLWDWSLQITTE